jgi:hypothetical protein
MAWGWAMPLEKLARVQTVSKEINQLQENVIRSVEPVLDNPLVDGVLLQSIILLSGGNTINHKLGRRLKGWIVTRIRASATIYDTQDTNLFPDLTLKLTASANVTVDLYVF